jgi:hypothetical protein
VEWAEVFIIGVYALEATHIMVESLGWKHGFGAGWVLFGIAILGPVLAFGALRPDRKDSPFRFGWLVPLFAVWLLPFVLRAYEPSLFESEGHNAPNRETDRVRMFEPVEADRIGTNKYLRQPSEPAAKAQESPKEASSGIGRSAPAAPVADPPARERPVIKPSTQPRTEHRSGTSTSDQTKP